MNLQQIDIERLYVDVYVLETPSYISHATIPDLLKVSNIRENFDRLGLGERGERVQGLEAANQYEKLMEQVESFANNWFSTINETPEETNKLTTQFLEKLKSPENKQMAELAVTPILLSLTCWVLSDLKKFPSKRSDLYKEGINLLLVKWEETKGLRRDSGSEIHRKMSVEDKQEVLSYIAFHKFEQQQYALFKETELQEYIAEYLRISTEQAEKLPKTIEAQHGLLVERAIGIYSFSHLTFQEFLTAQYIVYQDIPVKDIVKNHLTDSRWREVFLLLAELKQADDLLLTMEQQIQTYVTTPKLQELLAWAEQITDTLESDIKPVGKRAIALALAFAFASAFAEARVKAEANAEAHNRAEAKGYAKAKGYAQALTKALTEAKAYAIIKAYAQAIIKAYAQAITKKAHAQAITKAHPYTQADALKNLIRYAQEIKKLTVYKAIDLNELLDKLKKLKEKIPDDNQPTEKHRDLTNKIIQTVLETFSPTTEMIYLSLEEIEALDNYLSTNKLMVECKEAASQVSQETWNQIEARMLLPKNSWEKLKQQS